MAANKITLDNYRWAVRYTYRQARRTRAGRLATGLLLGPFDPALYACVRQLRDPSVCYTDQVSTTVQ